MLSYIRQDTFMALLMHQHLRKWLRRLLKLNCTVRYRSKSRDSVRRLTVPSTCGSYFLTLPCHRIHASAKRTAAVVCDPEGAAMLTEKIVLCQRS